MKAVVHRVMSRKREGVPSMSLFNLNCQPAAASQIRLSILHRVHLQNHHNCNIKSWDVAFSLTLRCMPSPEDSRVMQSDFAPLVTPKQPVTAQTDVICMPTSTIPRFLRLSFCTTAPYCIVNRSRMHASADIFMHSASCVQSSLVECDSLKLDVVSTKSLVNFIATTLSWRGLDIRSVWAALVS